MPDTNTSWKLGDEFLAYHPSASHVHPEFRDGWNACFAAARAHTAAETAPRAWQVDALLEGKWVPQWPVDATRPAAEKSMGFFEQTVEFRVVPLYAAPQPNAALADGWVAVPREMTPEMKKAAMELLMDTSDIYVNSHDQIEIQTTLPGRFWTSMLRSAPHTLNASKEGNGHG